MYTFKPKGDAVCSVYIILDILIITVQPKYSNNIQPKY